MCGKYILESVLYWAEKYHVDGFRFDLMGLLDTLAPEGGIPYGEPEVPEGL